MKRKKPRPLSTIGLAGLRGRPPAPIVRGFVLGLVAVAASVWALVRYYTHPHLPEVVPAQPHVLPAPSATEIPAPEVVPVP
jgi:hypothetical protein